MKRFSPLSAWCVFAAAFAIPPAAARDATQIVTRGNGLAGPTPGWIVSPHAQSAGSMGKVTEQAIRPKGMPVQRFAHATVLLPSGKVLAIGGLPGAGAYLASVDAYDPASHTWSAVASLGAARIFAAATVLSSGKVLVAGGRADPSGTALSSAELYDPATDAWSAVPAMSSVRDQGASVLLRSGEVLLAGGRNSLGAFLSSAERYDPATNAWSPAAGMALARIMHTLTLLPSGKVLVAGGGSGGGVSTSAEIYDPQTDSWSPAASMATARGLHAAVLLPSGRVLVAGGRNASNTPLSSAELYDPETDSWSPAAGLAIPRNELLATLLPSGRVLVVGGFNGTRLDSTEIYDPATDTWSPGAALQAGRSLHTVITLPTGQVLIAGGNSQPPGDELYTPAVPTILPGNLLPEPRLQHTASLLSTGQVLVAGGHDGSDYLTSSRLYDPATDQWTAAGPLAAAHQRGTATLLPSGKVLVAGGIDSSGQLDSAELFDPATGQWSATGSLSTVRSQSHTATLLPSGQVLVAGGSGGGAWLGSAELFDPATGQWTPTGALAGPRGGHTATLLPSGQVLVVGGRNTSVFLNSAELFDPATGQWTPAGTLATARGIHTATLLPSGQVLVAGGVITAGGAALGSAELYDPATNQWTPTGSLVTARQNHRANLLPSGQVLVLGGTGTAVPNTAELYDPATGQWSATGLLTDARASHTATLLPSGAVLVVGGSNGSAAIAGSARFDPGLAPMAALQPDLASANAFLLQTSPITGTSAGTSYDTNGAVLATGLRPWADNGGGYGQQHGRGVPVFQVQRIDSGQQRFIPADPGIELSDTSYTGSADALAGFPAGPVLVRVWVNGVPSASRYSTVATPPGQMDAPTASGDVGQATVDFTPPADSGGAPATGYTATAAPGGATASCAAPCTGILFDPIAPGVYTFTVHAANMAGDGPESPPSNAATVTGSSTTTLASDLNPSSYGQSVTFTATVSGSSALTGSVSFLDGATPICTDAALSGAMATCTTSTLAAGAHGVMAEYANDPINGGSTSSVVNQQVNPVGQTITFGPQIPASHVFVPGGSFPLNPLATTSSGLPVSYSSLTGGICTIGGTTVTMVAVGTCTIAADQPGDGNHVAALQVTQAIAIGRIDQTIAFTSTAPTDAVVGGTPYTVTATASSGLPVTLAVDAGAADVCALSGSASGSALTFHAAGICTINANQPGDASHAAAPQLQQAFAVARATSTVALASSPNPSSPGQPVTFIVTVSSDAGVPTGTVELSDNGVPLATLTLADGTASHTISNLSVGTHTILATYAGDSAIADGAVTHSQQVTGVEVVPTTVPALAWPMLVLLAGMLGAFGWMRARSH